MGRTTDPKKSGLFSALLRPNIRQTPRQILWDYGQITLGCLMMAVTNDVFWVPHSIVSGGVSGVGIIAHHLLGWPVGLVILALNLPLFIAGLRWGGGITTGIRTIYAVTVMSVAIDLLAPVLHSPTDNPLLIITYGSLIDGVAMGLVFRAQGTTGGTDIMGRLLRHFTGLEISRGVFAVNALTTLGAIVVFGLEKAMYGIMVAALCSWAIDVVLSGGRRARQVIVISEQWQAVRDLILSKLERGVTILEARGAYTDIARPLLLVVIAPSELAPLRQLVLEADPDAFVIVAATNEVWGQGFSSIHSEV
jgi:uncharacterized membrane-anchored protein YitT (DUF2179 family)